MYYIPDILGYRKSQARLSSALLESDPSAAISLWEEKNTSTQELKNGFLDRNQLTKSQKVESRVQYHRELIDIIRAEGADNLIIVDGEAWGQDYHTQTIANHAQEIMSGNENIMFSVHVYDQWTNQDIGAYFDTLEANPAFLTQNAIAINKTLTRSRFEPDVDSCCQGTVRG